METQAICGHCGTPLANGLCPRCLIDVGLSPEHEEAPAASDAGLALARFGDYELLEEIGRGGMGIVYRARQISVDRIVAVKLLPFGGLGGPELALRLRAEAVAAGSLRHPNIVAIHEVGLHQGQHFLVMDFVAGPSLARVLRDGPLPARRAALLMRQVALAVQHAHERGIIHRDLKPSNILLDAADDEPRITDFGLAKNLRADTQLTHTGQTLGSPNYIPPEQIKGSAGDSPATVGGSPTEPGESPSPNSGGESPREAGQRAVLPRGKISFASDVYSLGAILYHALTGRPLFIGADIAAVLQQVLRDEPLPPRRLNPSVATDLETICLKCLEKEPSRRYQTAAALAEDLERFLKDEPILARPVTRAERAWRWCRRKPALASSLLVILLLLLIVIIGSPIAVFRVNRERRQAELRAYTSDMNLVQQAWEEGHLKRAQALLHAHIPKRGEPDLRGFEWRYLWKLCRDESQFSFTNFSAGVQMALSSEGSFVIAADGRMVKLLDCAGRRELATLMVPIDTDRITALALSPVQTDVLATACGRTLNLWSLNERRITGTITLSNPAFSLAISRDGKLLAAAGGQEQAIELWRIEDRSLLWTGNTPTPVKALAFAPDGKSLASGGGERSEPLLWDLATGASSPVTSENRGMINAIVFSPDGRLMATTSTDSTVILWDFAKRKSLARLIARAGSVGPAEFSPDSRWLVTGSEDSTIRLWDVVSGQQKAIYRGHQEDITGVAFSPDARLIFSSSSDRTVKVWDREPRSRDETLASGKSWLTSVAFSTDGKRLASVGLEWGVLTLWDVVARSRIADLSKPSASLNPVAAFSPNGKYLAQVSEQGIKLWDAKTLAALGELTNGFDAISLSFSPDSRTLAAAGLSLYHLHGITNRLAFWDLTTKQRINKLAAAAPFAVIVSFSHDGRMVAIGHLDGEVRVWDYESERLLADFKDQQNRI